MNILIFSWRDPKHPLAGGAEQVMHEHARGWVAAEHKVTLFASRFKNSPREEQLDGVRVIRGGYQYLGVQIAAFFYYLRNAKNYDFVVDQFHGIPFFTPLYARKPILAVIQEPARDVWFTNPLPSPLNWIVGFLGYLAEPFVFRPLYRNVKFMTGSESAKDEVSKYGIPKKNITVVPHGVILPSSKLKISAFAKASADRQNSKLKVITYLGVLSKDKGIEDALKCFTLLKKKLDFGFWVIGKPETVAYGERIRKLTEELNLGAKVKFWGFVSDNKKFELLSRSFVLINPSIREGWGLVNIEANVVGTPVIAYKVSGSVDSIKHGETGILVGKHDVKALAESVLELKRNQYLYRNLQKNAVAWSKEFNWEQSKSLSLCLVEEIFRKWGTSVE